MFVASYSHIVLAQIRISPFTNFSSPEFVLIMCNLRLRKWAGLQQLGPASSDEHGR